MTNEEEAATMSKDDVDANNSADEKEQQEEPLGANGHHGGNDTEDEAQANELDGSASEQVTPYVEEPEDEDAERDLPQVEVKEEDEGKRRVSLETAVVDTWEITKRDIPIPASIASQMIEHADVVLSRRIEGTAEDMDLDRFERKIPRFQNKEIRLGRKIGFGNFADIYAIDGFLSATPSPKCTKEQLEEAKKLREVNHPNALVVKVIKSQLLVNYGLFATGAADVLVEGTLLASLDHPHILSIRGRSASGLGGFTLGKRDAFFLIFERLEGTLQGQMTVWNQKLSQIMTTMPGFRRRDSRYALLMERVHLMTDLAAAMVYLHERNIIHRDLKLTNVGVDYNGRAKLFDFGLAKVVPASTSENELFNLTGNTGSVRYMAPEIGRGEQYNLKADVYSFALLLWEVMSLAKVWQGWNPNEIRDKVHVRQQRPSISFFWPSKLKELLRNAWADSPTERISMEKVHLLLSQQMEDFFFSN